MIRIFDVIFSAIAFIVLLPLFIIVVIILKFTGEGEIFYKQERIGERGEKFNILKFATMLKDSPLIGTKSITIEKDPRVLPFGKLLRSTKINELPQILNVFTGKMSLIGPRPLTKEGFLNYSKSVQSSIIKVKPGLSGIGSIIFSNEERFLRKDDNPVDFWKTNITPYKGDLEKWYINNLSLKNYFLLIFLTVGVLFFPKFVNVFKILKGLPKPPKVFDGMFN